MTSGTGTCVDGRCCRRTEARGNRHAARISASTMGRTGRYGAVASAAPVAAPCMMATPYVFVVQRRLRHTADLTERGACLQPAQERY